MSKTADYQRMERLVKECHQSGQGQATFAKFHGITESKFVNWAILFQGKRDQLRRNPAILFL